MNPYRHTHQVRLTRNVWGDGPYYVEYGDTKVCYAWPWRLVKRWSPKKLERKVAKATAKAIRRHDQGSVRAGQYAAAEAAAQAKAQELVGKGWPA